MPDIEEDLDIEVNQDDLRIDTYRSSGAGGQHINKMCIRDSCRLVVDRYFTTSSTTFDRENTRGYKSICEVLPI